MEQRLVDEGLDELPEEVAEGQEEDVHGVVRAAEKQGGGGQADGVGVLQLEGEDVGREGHLVHGEVDAGVEAEDEVRDAQRQGAPAKVRQRQRDVQVQEVVRAAHPVRDQVEVEERGVVSADLEARQQGAELRVVVVGLQRHLHRGLAARGRLLGELGGDQGVELGQDGGVEEVVRPRLPEGVEDLVEEDAGGLRAVVRLVGGQQGLQLLDVALVGLLGLEVGELEAGEGEEDEEGEEDAGGAEPRREEQREDEQQQREQQVGAARGVLQDQPHRLHVLEEPVAPHLLAHGLERGLHQADHLHREFQRADKQIRRIGMTIVRMIAILRRSRRRSQYRSRCRGDSSRIGIIHSQMRIGV